MKMFTDKQVYLELLEARLRRAEIPHPELLIFVNEHFIDRCFNQDVNVQRVADLLINDRREQ